MMLAYGGSVRLYAQPAVGNEDSMVDEDVVNDSDMMIGRVEVYGGKSSLCDRP